MIFIYNALFTVVVGRILSKKLKTEKYKKLYLCLCFLQMFIIQGFRAETVGTDTTYYLTVYNRFGDSEYYSYLFTHYELGYQWLYILLRNIGADQQWLLIIISAVTMLGFSRFIYKNSNNIVLSTFIFACLFFPNTNGAMRQYLASAIAINSLTFAFDRKFIRAFITIAIASMFHITAILFIAPVLLYLFRFWKFNIYVLLLSVGVVIICGDVIVDFLLDVFGRSLYNSNSTVYSINRIFRLTTFVTLLVAVLLIYYSFNEKDKSKRNQTMLFVCVAILNFDCGILYLKYEIMSRLIELFNLFLIISIPRVTTNLNSQYASLIRVGCWCAPFLLMINFVFLGNAGILPYSFFFMG